jgi:hypothetical protein
MDAQALKWKSATRIFSEDMGSAFRRKNLLI